MQDKYKIEKEIYNKEKVKSGTKKWSYFWDSNLLSAVKEKYNSKPTKWGEEFLRDKKILILGASRGDAKFCYQFSQNITAIDISDRQIKEIQEIFPQMQTIVGDVTTYDFPENKYDVIFCTSILHHLPGDLDLIFNKLYRALIPKGVIFIYSEPLLLNPMLLLGRKFFPSQYHTPNEKPFISRKFKRIFDDQFIIIAENYQFFLTLGLAVFMQVTKLNKFKILKQISFFINKIFYKIDQGLSKTLIREFFWYFSMILKKK